MQLRVLASLLFFFQAEDGIRDYKVTGVQTCALPICLAAGAALVGHTGIADNPDVQAAATVVERAWLALQRTSVRAPVTGYVARRSVQLGERIAPGGPLMAIVPLARLPVDANFREVQLNHMRIGQPVTLIADLYGGRVEYRGTVAGLGLGTGAAFALLPAQNATGNWIKVVQRVPVRITLDPRQLAAHQIGRAHV